MNLRELEYFVAVAETKNFSEAAYQCFVTQPTLSSQLKKLEDELGHALFIRNTRVVKLSTFGEEVLPLAKNVLAGVKALEQKAQALQDPFVGRLSVGAFPTLAPWLLPRLSRVWRQDYPESAFYLREEKSQVLQQKLLQDQMDCAFLALPQDDLPDMEVLPIFRETFYVAVGKQHPWRKLRSISPSKLKRTEFLLLEDGQCLRDQALDFCHRFGAQEHDMFKATSLETLREMVRMQVGITLVPRLAVPEKPERGLRYIPIKNAENVAYRDIALCFRKTHPRRLMFEDLVKKMRLLCDHALPVQALSEELLSNEL